jgi:hypothetical protein
VMSPGLVFPDVFFCLLHHSIDRIVHAAGLTDSLGGSTCSLAPALMVIPVGDDRNAAVVREQHTGVHRLGLASLQSVHRPLVMIPRPRAER